MKTKSIGVSDSYTKGRNQYNKLPRTEQLMKEAVEGARQNFNENHPWYRLSSPTSDLGKFIQRSVRMKKILNNVLKRFGKK